MIDPRQNPRQGGPAQLEGGHWQLVGQDDSHAENIRSAMTR